MNELPNFFSNIINPPEHDELELVFFGPGYRESILRIKDGVYLIPACLNIKTNSRE